MIRVQAVVMRFIPHSVPSLRLPRLICSFGPSMFSIRRVVLSLLLILPIAAHAGAGADELKRFVNDTRSVSAQFTQVQTNDRGEKVASSAGSMLLARPGRFRWSYHQPYEQLMVCDGQRIWLYDPDLAQVTVRPAAEALAGTPAALLAQKSTLTDQFSIEELGRRENSDGVRLRPLSADSDFESIELWLSRGAPDRMVFLDRLGNRTEVGFREIEVNARIDESLLKFTPPNGVEIVESGLPRTAE
jgi:chaperone LolA